MEGCGEGKNVKRRLGYVEECACKRGREEGKMNGISELRRKRRKKRVGDDTRRQLERKYKNLERKNLEEEGRADRDVRECGG